MPEVPSGGSLEPSAPAGSDLQRGCLTLGFTAAAVPARVRGSTTCPKHSGELLSLLWAGRKCRCGRLSARAGTIPRTVNLSQCLVKCHYMIIRWPVSQELSEVWDMGQAESCHQCHCSAAGWLGCPMPTCRSPTLCWAAGHASTVSLCTWMLCVLRTCKVVLPHHPPRDFKMVEMAKMHYQLLWKVHPGWSPGFPSPGSVSTVCSLLSICDFS